MSAVIVRVVIGEIVDDWSIYLWTRKIRWANQPLVTDAYASLIKLKITVKLWSEYYPGFLVLM